MKNTKFGGRLVASITKLYIWSLCTSLLALLHITGPLPVHSQSTTTPDDSPDEPITTQLIFATSDQLTLALNNWQRLNSGSSPQQPSGEEINIDEYPNLSAQSASLLGTSIHFLGGVTSSSDGAVTSPSTHHYFFDVTATTPRLQRVVAPPELYRASHTSHIINGTNWILFGRNTTSPDLVNAVVTAYDVKTGNAFPLTTAGILAARFGHSSVLEAQANRLWVFGGETTRGVTGEFMFLDLRSLGWFYLSRSRTAVSGFLTLPTPIAGHASQIIDDYLVTCFGAIPQSGFGETSAAGFAANAAPRLVATNECFILNLRTLRFSNPTVVGTERPRSRVGVGSAMVLIPNTKTFLVVGGAELAPNVTSLVTPPPQAFADDVWILDCSDLPNSIRWRKQDTANNPFASKPRAFHTVTLIGDRVFVWGGLQNPPQGSSSGGGVGGGAQTVDTLDVQSWIWEGVDKAVPVDPTPRPATNGGHPGQDGTKGNDGTGTGGDGTNGGGNNGDGNGQGDNNAAGAGTGGLPLAIIIVIVVSSVLILSVIIAFIAL
ncbi:hypothetical protein HK102_004045, partial [Quaeritorhiza haematococci]